MPSPTAEMLKKIARDFNIRCSFPNYIKSTAAKHSRTQCSPKTGKKYLNNKQYNSVVLQRIEDANIKLVLYLWT